MSIERPTLREVPPYDGTRLGWDHTLYALLGLVGEVVWVSSTPTQDTDEGPGIVFRGRLHRVVTVERDEEDEWAMMLMFEGGSSVSIPRPGFRGAVAAGHDVTVVTEGSVILVGLPTV
jgi:hypothetical protein